MNAHDLNEMLLAEFPELKEKLNEYMKHEDGLDTGAFLTYEDIFRRHLEEAIINNDSAFIDKTARFIESILERGDDYASNVIIVGVLEGLKANCDNDKVRAFLLENSLEEFNSIVY